MDLSLHSSQINLATRDKKQAPSIYYPPVHIHRPASASFHHRNRLTTRNGSSLSHNRRPLSADSRFMSTKGHSSVKFNLGNRSSNSSSNIFKLLIDEQPKFWSSNLKSNASNPKVKEIVAEADSTSCGESIEEEVVTIKSNNIMESRNNDANVQKHHHEPTKNFSMSPHPSAMKRRPDSLKLSMDYSSSMDLLKSTSNNNEGKLSAPGNNSKTAKSYDLWVNENIESKDRNVESVEKKLDLPGRVSFSTNDVYEIDYSDYDDQETESSQASGHLEKLNKSPIDVEEKTEPTDIGKQYIKEHYMSNSDNELDDLEFRYHHSKGSDKSSKINQIIEDYKNEVSLPISHREASGELNNSKGKVSVASKLNQSTNPVIKNYLKTKEQDVTDGYNNNTRVSITTSNKKLNDLSKKSKTFKELTKPKLSNSNGYSTLKTPPAVKPMHPQPPSILDKAKKPKSPSASSIYARQDSNLDEFQIEKVVSWMSVNEENFSEFEFNMAGQASSGGEGKASMMMGNRKGDEHDSTYQEIVDIIKEIEHDRKDNEDFKTLKTDVEFKLNTILNSIESPDDSPTNECHDGEIGGHTKLKEIFSYLDKVDSTSDKALIGAKGNGIAERDNLELEFALEPDVIEDVPKISDLLMLPNHQLARRIVKLSLRANELSNAIQLSKEHVANVRGDKAKTLRLEKLNGQSRLKEQKKHYEDIVARHQTFIEQLIKDKAALCEKVSQITRRLDSQNQAWEHRMKTEVDKAKEQAMAGEKIRRERWVRDNTKKIKELTVKGLELEINKMSTNHKQESEALKRQHHLDVLKAIEETKSSFEKTEKSIRESYADEREQAIERERKAIKERFEKQMEDERKSAEQQRMRMIHDFESEKDRLYAEMREKEHIYEMKREELMNEKMEVLEDTKENFKDKLKQRDAKHQMELTKLQEQYETDFKIWKRECETKMKLRETERDNSIREQYRLERDRQIDGIVAKVDAESIKSQQDYEVKFNRLKEKYEHEIRELEHSEKSLKDKYIETRSRLAEGEANNQNLKSVVTQMELQLNHTTKLCEKFTAEKDSMKEEARNEIKNELQNINKEHEMEIQRIYSRVQQAIQKKDATLDALHKDNAALRERNLKLDAIIRQQRKDYCTK